MIFLVVAASVVGGVSLYGGKGRLIGALGGVLFIGVITSVLTWLELEVTIIDFTQGALILFAVCVDAIKNKIGQRLR